MIKHKTLSNGTLVTCDGSRHTYLAIDEKNLTNQPNSALCWCHTANKEQLDKWTIGEK